MVDARLQTLVCRTVFHIARAFRAEFGADIDAHPGGPDGSNAGQVNRAYQVVVRCLLTAIVPPSANRLRFVTEALRQAAQQRLIEARCAAPAIEGLLNTEPSRGDAWLAYLALAPPPVIRDLLEPESTDRQ